MPGLGGGSSEKAALLAGTEEHCLHSRRSALPLSTFTSYLSVALVTTLVYSRLHGTYLDDDQMAILQYREVVGCTSIWQLFDEAAALLRNDFWGIPLDRNLSHKSWRPLTTLTFRAGWCLHGDYPFGFHIVNTILHVLVTALFQCMCEQLVFHSRIVRRKSLRRSLAWVSAMLYGIHPIHVECVTNIVGRAEPLSAIFFILAIFASRYVLSFVHAPLVVGAVGLGDELSSSGGDLLSCMLTVVRYVYLFVASFVVLAVTFKECEVSLLERVLLRSPSSCASWQSFPRSKGFQSYWSAPTCKRLCGPTLCPGCFVPCLAYQVP